jgi:hypothetical protein
MSALLLCAAALLVVLSPGAAAACAVCTGAGEESRAAFIATTVMLSVLPLGMIGGLVWWIWRRTKADGDGPGR